MSKDNFAAALAAKKDEQAAPQAAPEAVVAKAEAAAGAILSGMENAVVGTHLAAKPTKPVATVTEGWQSVHVSKIDGVAGIKQRGRWAWSKTMLDEKSERLQTLIAAKRVSVI